MSSVQTILTRFKVGKPQCSTNYALQLLNDAYKSLGITTELSQGIYVQSLTQGVREYILPGNIVAVQEAYWYWSGTPGDGQILYQTSTDELAERRQGWRAFSWQGQSWNVYISTTAASNATEPATASLTGPGSAMLLGFDPPPNVTSQGTYPAVYPNVTLYVSQTFSLLISDYLPDYLGPDELWIDKLETLYTKSQMLSEVQYRQELSAMSHQETVSRVKNQMLQSQTTIRPAWGSRRRRI